MFDVFGHISSLLSRFSWIVNIVGTDDNAEPAHVSHSIDTVSSTDDVGGVNQGATTTVVAFSSGCCSLKRDLPRVLARGSIASTNDFFLGKRTVGNWDFVHREADFVHGAQMGFS